MGAMTITLSNVSKRFNFEVILRNITYTFESRKSYAVIGPNGSGKSTLLQLLAGAITPSTGVIQYKNDHSIDGEEIFKHVSISAPYLELIEELSFGEHIRFQKQFKKNITGWNEEEIIAYTGLQSSSHKPIKLFSSGMKQRAKLALAFFSDAPILLLDEPTTNLDKDGVNWYLKMIEQFTANRLVIVGSNIEREYAFCTAQLDVMQFK